MGRTPHDNIPYTRRPAQAIVSAFGRHNAGIEPVELGIAKRAAVMLQRSGNVPFPIPDFAFTALSVLQVSACGHDQFSIVRKCRPVHRQVMVQLSARARSRFENPRRSLHYARPLAVD